MSLLHALILGIIEGLTEFFPISSTGHLIVAERVLGITNPSLFFNVVIQVGAILAVVVYYNTQIIAIARQAFAHPLKSNAVYLAIATAPVLVIGAAFHKYIEQFQTSVRIVAIMSIAIAALMYVIQQYRTSTLAHGKSEKEKTWKDYLVIGLFQSISVIPGTSRSGSTLLGGLIQKFSFKDAMDTSFILGIPAMGAAAAFESVKLFTSGVAIDSSLLIGTTIGFVTAFIVALLTIYLTLPILRRYGFTPFIVYRVGLGLFLLMFFR